MICPMCVTLTYPLSPILSFFPLSPSITVTKHTDAPTLTLQRQCKQQNYVTEPIDIITAVTKHTPRTHNNPTVTAQTATALSYRSNQHLCHVYCGSVITRRVWNQRSASHPKYRVYKETRRCFHRSTYDAGQHLHLTFGFLSAKMTASSKPYFPLAG